MLNEYTETVFSVNRNYTILDVPPERCLRENAQMEFTANLKRLRNALGLSQERLAELVGVAQATVQRWEGGAREPSHADLVNLARALHVTVAHLFSSEEDDVIRPANAEEVVEFKLLGDVPAGNWREAVKHSSISIPVPTSDAPSQGYALRVDGDSMDLVVPDGTVIIVDPTDKDFWSGRYYVVMNGDGETTFKQYKDNPARLVPCSSNPDHKEIPVSGGDFQVLGRVVWQGGRL